MDSGLAAIFGAIIGGATSIATTWLSEHLRNRRGNRLDKIRKERLLQMLSVEKYKWRSMTNLSDSIGCDEETTAALLLELGARKSRTGGSEKWGLISRNPITEE